MNSIEIELRGFLTPEGKINLEKQLLNNGILGVEDNRDTTFYIIDRGTLKVAKSSNGTAKLAFKKGDFVKDDGLVEIEIPIKPEDVEKMNSVLGYLGFNDIQITQQKRTNYDMGNGIELSVKYSKDWGEHFEIDKVIEDSQDEEKAKAELMDILKEYNLSIATEEEIENLKQRVDGQYK